MADSRTVTVCLWNLGCVTRGPRDQFDVVERYAYFAEYMRQTCVADFVYATHKPDAWPIYGYNGGSVSRFGKGVTTYYAKSSAVNNKSAFSGLHGLCIEGRDLCVAHIDTEASGFSEHVVESFTKALPFFPYDIVWAHFDKRKYTKDQRRAHIADMQAATGTERKRPTAQPSGSSRPKFGVAYPRERELDEDYPYELVLLTRPGLDVTCARVGPPRGALCIYEEDQKKSWPITEHYPVELQINLPPPIRSEEEEEEVGPPSAKDGSYHASYSSSE